MGRKIFVSYKYNDNDVEKLYDSNSCRSELCTVRSYVNKLEKYFEERSDHIYKGENDGESLSSLSDATIQNYLYNRIYDSSLTIIMVSPGMQDWRREENQWIPREISYSLRKQSRKNGTGESIISDTNAMLAVVLPNRIGSYDYFFKQCSCVYNNCSIYNLDFLFQIMRKNTYNLKQRDYFLCLGTRLPVLHSNPSYILYVKWCDFCNNPELYISEAYKIREHKDDYDIHVQL